ncbi:MAG: helix-turn-helix transcriptional regulator [Clostridia bacterium]|nr:helix-turn-helix transcriptional regulator [Clostridia bacterium]
MDKLKEIRLARNMTQAEVADAAGVALNLYQKYEYMRSKP